MIVDDKLNSLIMKYSKKPIFSYYTSVVQNLATGCTCVFNAKALYFYKKGILRN